MLSVDVSLSKTAVLGGIFFSFDWLKGRRRYPRQRRAMKLGFTRWRGWGCYSVPSPHFAVFDAKHPDPLIRFPRRRLLDVEAAVGPFEAVLLVGGNVRCFVECRTAVECRLEALRHPDLVGDDMRLEARRDAER